METALLYLFCAMAVAGGVAMLVVRHPMRVAIALVTTMLSLAGIYALVGVHVIAVFQVLIYVGAVMVFMVYVIMLVGTSDRPRFSRLAIPGVIALVALVLVLRYALAGGEPSATTAQGAFDLRKFSEAFLNEYWLYFELTSVLLVAAIVAAISVVKIKDGRRG